MRGRWVVYREAIAPLTLLGIAAAATVARLAIDVLKAWVGG